MNFISMPLPNWMKRFLSILILVPCVAYITFFGPPLSTLFCIVLSLGLSYEWLSLTKITSKWERKIFYGLILMSFLVFFLGGIKFSFACLLGGFASFYYILRVLHYRQKEAKSLNDLEGSQMHVSKIKKSMQSSWLFWGGIYVGLPCLSFLWIYEEYAYAPYIILETLLIIWGCDIGGYLCGSWIGGPKLAPRISPKKTWSGFLGGILGGEILGWGGGYLFGISSPWGLSLFSLCIILLAVAGDLLESKIKRVQKVKDSGTLIPGHGGLFDRLDSTLIILPFLAIYLSLSKTSFFSFSFSW